MGCPQSKHKDIADGNEVNKKSRNDVIRPEPEPEKARTIHKTPHAYNDDPLVKGRCDDIVPPDITISDTNEEENAKKNHDNVDVENDTPVAETSATDASMAEETDVHKAQNGTAMEDEKKDADKPTDVSFQSVFTVDDSDADRRHSDADTDVKSVDVNDVNISQGINEITMGNQVISAETGRSESFREKTMPEPTSATPLREASRADHADGFKHSEYDRNSWEGKSSVRYVSNNKIEYGIPEGAPKPTPPKTKKNDIINPTTFTVVDKIVEQAPDNAFNSVPKLASYLSGTKKKEVEDLAGDEDSETTNLPPIKPVLTKKTEILAKDGSNFRTIDENARNTPESMRLSVDRLASHLCKDASTDMEKVRAFYYWICNNISYVYDRDKTLSDKMRFDAVSTLRQGQGSYVNLMSALCKEVGVPVVTIPGCSKGLRHQPDREFSVAERNHSWNAVYLSNEWRFIDCTWGSGYVDVNGKFQKQFDEFWFLTDPEVFAYDHFPSHSLWQLLETPIEIEEFNKKPSLTERSRELGFRLISHREPIVYFDGEVTVSFATETYPLSNVTADLRDEDRSEINQHRCMKRIDNKTFEVRVVPPIKGEYTLVLYGKARDYRHAKFRKLMEYTLRCESAYADQVVFPDHKKAWGPEPNYAELGFTETMEEKSVFKCDSEEMCIELEQSKNVPIIVELKSASDIKNELIGYTMITAQAQGKRVHIRFPTSGYFRLDVYAEGKSEKYEYAALFLLECTVDKPTRKYPKFNADAISKHVCEIIEPLDLEIPSNSLVMFKIRSSGLKNAMLGIPTEQDYGSRMKGLGELKKTDDIWSREITTPAAGEVIFLSGSAAPPNVFWSRLYEYVTV